MSDKLQFKMSLLKDGKPIHEEVLKSPRWLTAQLIITVLNELTDHIWTIETVEIKRMPLPNKGDL